MAFTIAADISSALSSPAWKVLVDVAFFVSAKAWRVTVTVAPFQQVASYGEAIGLPYLTNGHLGLAGGDIA